MDLFNNNNNTGYTGVLPSGYDYNNIKTINLLNSSGIDTNINTANSSMSNITPTSNTTDQGLIPLIYGTNTNGYPLAPSNYGNYDDNNNNWSLSNSIKNLGGLQGIASLAGSIGGIYSGIQQLNLAKKAFKFQKSMAEKNYANTVKSYNTALQDRATSRGVMQSQSQDQVNNYINENKLA